MSIYPVKIRKWFPPEDKSEDNKFRREIILSILPYMKCKVCNTKKLKMKSAWVYHALPYGYAADWAWCSTWCYKRDNDA